MPSFSVQQLTNFFVRCEISVLNLEESNDRSCRLMGLVDRGNAVLNSPAVQSIMMAKQRKLRQTTIRKLKEDEKNLAASESSAQQELQKQNENGETFETKHNHDNNHHHHHHLPAFSQQNVFTASPAKKTLQNLHHNTTPTKNRRLYAENEEMDNKTPGPVPPDCDDYYNSVVIPTRRLAAVIIGVDSTLADLMFPLISSSTLTDDDLDGVNLNDSNTKILSKFINDFVSTETSDQEFDEVIIQRRVYELKLAALRHSLNAFFDVCAIAATQSMTLPLKIPPFMEKSNDGDDDDGDQEGSYLNQTHLALIAFRPAVLFVSTFCTFAIEARKMQLPSSSGGDDENDQSNNNNSHVLSCSMLLSNVDTVVEGVCKILSKALLPSGFLGPAILSAWWKFFIRSLEPSALLKELDSIEKQVWNFPCKNVTTTTTTSLSGINNKSSNNAATLVLKLVPELPLLSAIALLMLPESQENYSLSSSSSPSTMKIEQEIQKQLLLRCSSLCNQGLSYAKEIRDSSTGWMVSRGSRACVLALLVRAEVQRRQMRHTAALDDTKEAVVIDEGAKVFSGEEISPNNCKVVNSMVMEFAPSLFPSFGNDLSHAKLFLDAAHQIATKNNMDFAPKNPFMVAHEALWERHVAKQNEHETREDDQQLPPCRDVTTMLVCIHRAVSSSFVNINCENRDANGHKTNAKNYSPDHRHSKTSNGKVIHDEKNKIFSSDFSAVEKVENNDFGSFRHCAFSSCCNSSNHGNYLRPQHHSSSQNNNVETPSILAVTAIHKTIGEILSLPNYISENDEISNSLAQSSYLSSIFTLTCNSKQQNDPTSPMSSSSPSLSPNAYLQRKQKMLRGNNRKQQQVEDDEDEMNKKYLPPAEFCVCPGLIERISWISQTLVIMNNNNRSSISSSSPFCCLGKKLWGSSIFCCCSCSAENFANNNSKNKIIMSRSNDNNNNKKSLPALPPLANNTNNKTHNFLMEKFEHRANTTIPTRNTTFNKDAADTNHKTDDSIKPKRPERPLSALLIKNQARRNSAPSLTSASSFSSSIPKTETSSFVPPRREEIPRIRRPVSRSQTPIVATVEERPITFSAFVKQHQQQNQKENENSSSLSKNRQDAKEVETKMKTRQVDAVAKKTTASTPSFLKRRASSLSENVNTVSRGTPIPKKESLVKAFFQRAAAGSAMAEKKGK